MKKDVNEELLMKLPKWIHERAIYLHNVKEGRTSYYHAILLPFEYDIRDEKVEFYACGIRQFRSQLNKYFRGCLRPEINMKKGLSCH